MAFEIRMPHLGMIMTEGTLAKWLKEAGAYVRQGEPLAEVTTEKITYEVEAPENGIFRPVVEEGATVAVEGLLAYLLAEGEATPEVPTEEKPVPAPSSPDVSRPPHPPPEVEVRAAPGARRLAKELGIAISQVSPSRPGARIVEADVKAYAEKLPEGPQLPPPAALPAPTKVEPVRGMRKIIAEKMRQSVANTAQLSFHLEVDLTEAEALRRQHSKDSDVALSTADIFIKACAEALPKHPKLNTLLIDGTIQHFDQVNIGLAVALEDGLIVPVINDAGSKDIFQIAKERSQLVEKARAGKLLPDDTLGGTFTLTVLGVVDGFTPILNPGQSAILGVGRVASRPVVRGSEIVARTTTVISLTVDHQVIDGAPAVSFLRRLEQILRQPAHLFRV